MKKLTNFFNCAANGLQKTGGGSSQFLTVEKAVWNATSPTVNRRSTDSQSQGRYTHTPLCKTLKYAAVLLMVFMVGVGQMWGANGDVLFSQNFNTVNSTTGLAFRYNWSGTSTYSYDYSTSATLSGLVGNGSNLFTSLASSIKKGDLAVNSSTGGGASSSAAIDATGIFQAYSGGDNSGYWSLVRTADFAATAPTALKISMDVFFNPLASGSRNAIQFAVGDDFTDGLKSTTSQATSVVHSGFAFKGNSTATITKYDAYGTNLYSTDIKNEWKSIVWVINNTGEKLKYDNPTGSGQTELNDDCFDIWLKPKDSGSYTLIVHNSAGFTGTQDLQNIHIGCNIGSAKHDFRMDNLIVTDLTPASGDPSCEATANAGADKNTTIGVGVAMAATAAGEGYTGAWSIKSGSPSTATSQLGTTSSNTMTFTPSTYGTYTLVWTVTDNSDGTCSASDEATVTVPAPTHAIEYTNTKGAVNTNPDTYTEGTGIASFAKLRHAVGYDFTGWSPTSIAADATGTKTVEAQWTANAVAEGTGTLTYALAFSSGTITTSSITRVNGALYDATDVSLDHTSFNNNSTSKGCSGKLTTTAAKDNNNYVEVTFKVADGYTFTPTEVRVQGIAVTTSKTIEVELTDNADTPNSKSVSGTLTAVDSPTTGGYTVTLDFDESDPVVLEGTVTAKIYAYGANDHWRMGTPFVITGTVAVPATPCAATAPGDIEKGEASGGTGKITLKVEDDGAPVSGDTWYWQSSASGEDDEDEYDAENGKEVSAAGTYYLRSYNTAGECWSTAKSVTVAAADLLTAISPTLSYATSNIVVGNTSSPTLEGNTGSGSVSYALNNVSPAGSLTIDENTGVVTAVTVGGTATVTATIAANGNYAGNTATSGTITVVAPATGTATVSFALSGSTTTGTVSGVSTISSLSSSLTLSTLTLSGTKDGYSGEIVGCTSTEALDEDDYVDVQFTVASGYAFTPSAVIVQVNPIKSTSALKAVVKIMDAQPLVVASNVLACEKTTDNEVTFASGAFTDKEFEGTVHIRMYFYGAASDKTFYIKSPITITGTVATKVVKYDLSFAAGTGASGSMSTLKYAASTEVTLPACTFTAPSGKEFDAWVVTKTVGGASVTVEDGVFTMPAEAVTATATWKDRPKHTDATLSDLTVGGTTVAGFDAATISYNVELPFGTTSAPTVAATATDASYVKSVVVTQASSATEDATVVVTAEDGSTTKTYTVHFSVVASKDIELVWATDKQRCDATTPSAKALIATASTYLSASYTGSAAESGSLTTGKTTGSKIIITAQPGYAFKAMGFYGKIEDGTCNFYNDGVVETIGTSTSDACYADVFSNDEVHEFVIELTGSNGVYIRNMQLTMIQACTPKTIAWTAEPAAEYELGSSPDAIAASANNGTITYASSDADVLAVNESTGALTLKALGTVTLSASVPAGDGVTYCDEGAQVSKANVKTYYLVTFDKQNGESATLIKYYKNDAAIALPETPTYAGFDFWEAQCDGPTITAQPTSANYLTGRTPVALACTATAGDAGELTYAWYSCDDAIKTNPVALGGAPTPSTAAAGTFYYYCVVTEAGCDVQAISNVATITVADKDPVCIIKATPTSENEATADGAYKGDAAIKSSNKKLSSKYDYVAVQLMEGKSFLATDKVVLNQAADLGDASDITKFYVFTEVPADGETYVTVDNASPIKGDNWFTMPTEMAGESSLYIGRVNSSCNPTVGYLAVYRVMMPELMAIKIDGRDGEIDALNDKHFNVTIPYEAVLTSLTVVPTIVRNAAHATTPEAVISNEGAWVLGDNTYRVMDKDGDYTDYTITLTRDELKHAVKFYDGETLLETVEVVDGEQMAAGDVPANPTKEDYLFQGWAETAGGDVVEVTSFTISATKNFYAKWVSDGAIKLIVDGTSGKEVNTTNYITGVAASKVTIGTTEYDCVTFAGTVGSSVAASNMKYLDRHVTYNATTTQTKVKLHLYNNSDNKRTIYVQGVIEGNTSTDDIVNLLTLQLNGKEEKTTDYIEFNNAKNRSIYVFVSSDAGDIKILQEKVIESGEPLKKAGDSGYSLNMNKGRMFGAQGATIAFEGMTYTLNGDYAPVSSTVLKVKSNNIVFVAAAPTLMKVTTANDKTYYVTKDAAGDDNETAKTGVSEFDLTAGTWYITAGGSEVQFTKIEFIAPKCEQPTVADMSDVELCEGVAFTELAVSASVSDEGTLHYAWYKVGETDEAVGDDEATYTPEEDGEYYVIVTNRKDNFTDNSKTSNTISVAHFAAAVITTAPEDVTKEVGQEATLTVVASGKNSTYEWFTCDDAEGTNPVAFEPAETGTSLTVTVAAGEQFYKVVVSSDCGEPVSAVAKVAEWREVPQANVTGTITWDWTNSAWPVGKEISFRTQDGDMTLLANESSLVPCTDGENGFRADMLLGSGQHIWRSGGADKQCFQGNELKFHTTVAGKVTVWYRSTNSGKDITININGIAAGHHSTTTYTASETIVVPANSDVRITKTGETYVRINKIVFDTDLVPSEAEESFLDGYERTVDPKYYGTVCLPKAGVMTGATLFQVAYMDYKDDKPYKVYYDEVENGTMQAGMPYIFLAEQSTIGVYYTGTAEETAKDHNGLHGTLVNITEGMNEAGIYMLYNNRVLHSTNPTSYLNANRAYIQLTEVPGYGNPNYQAPAPTRRRISTGFNGANSATGLENIQAVEGRVQKVLIDGKIYILRGEKIFDMTGKLVK